MSELEQLLQRSQSQCELCTSPQNLSIYEVEPASQEGLDSSVLVCNTCLEQLHQSSAFQARHWHCLSNTMWTEIPAVQVLIWRILSHLSQESWAHDLLDQLYLPEETLAWAKKGKIHSQSSPPESDSSDAISQDSNGNALLSGDSVTLIKDLEVKGANFTAKRGTIVKNISLTSNPEQIEGKVNGTRIVLLTKFLKKTSSDSN